MNRCFAKTILVVVIFGWLSGDQNGFCEGRLRAGRQRPGWAELEERRLMHMLKNGALLNMTSLEDKGRPYPRSAYQFVVASGSSKNETSSWNRRQHQRRSQDSNFETIIVGAGAAGLGAAYRLREAGVTNVVILEATSNLGGRMQVNKEFAGYPLDLGPSYLPGQWFLNELQRLANGADLRTTNPAGAGIVWQDYSYNDYFSDHIAPGLNIQYNCAVTAVDYPSSTQPSRNQIRVECSNGRVFTAPHVVVTASLKVLQDNDISFNPPLDRSLVDFRPWWPGLKIFMQFPNKFYDSSFCPGSPCYNTFGEQLFWDGTVSAPNPNQVPNLLAGYIGGNRLNGIPTSLSNIETANRLTRRFESHFNLTPNSLQVERFLLQDWRQMPFVKGMYSGPTSRVNSGASIVSRATDSPSNHMLLLAGGAFPIPNEEWAWVYSAFHSGFDAADKIFNHMVNAKPWVELNTENFEQFEGGSLWSFPAGATDAVLVTSQFCANGRCARLRDNSGASSSIVSDFIDVTLYTQIRLSYQFYMFSFEGVEDFLVEMRQGSSSWQTLKRHVHDQGLNQGDRQNSRTLVIDTNQISGSISLRFRCDASANNDIIYLDNIFVGFFVGRIGPAPVPSPAPTPSPTPTHENTNLICINQSLETYANHQASAQLFGGYLVSITDSPTNELVKGVARLGGAPGAWIGLDDRANEGSPVWTDTQATPTFTDFWFQRNRGQRDCVRMRPFYEYQWVINRCNLSFHGIYRLPSNQYCVASTSTTTSGFQCVVEETGESYSPTC